jgi:hypothetical protein
MKVICIEDKFKWEFAGRNYEPKDPELGEICTVINTMDFVGVHLYKLEGYAEWYNSKKFIPLSDIDETEMISEYNTQTEKV